MNCPPSPIRIADDGEVTGMLCQFASAFNLTRAAVLRVIRTQAPESVILSAGSGLDRFLIIDHHALDALRQCAEATTRPLRESAAHALTRTA